MSNFKIYSDDQIGTIFIYKTKKSRHNKLTLKQNGDIRLSIPRWASYKQGIEFAKRNQQWIHDHRPEPNYFENHSRIGKSYTLLFKPENSKINNSQIIVNNQQEHKDIIKDIYFYGAEALKRDCQKIIPDLVEKHSNKLSVKPNNLTFRNMSSRWGSCSPKGNLSFSIYSIQLPEPLLEYVVIHELCHLIHLNHSGDFWFEVKKYSPEYSDLRKQLKDYRLTLVAN